MPPSFTALGSGHLNDVEWCMLKDKIFTIYYDKNTTTLAQYARYSVQSAYPYMSVIFGVEFNNSNFSLVEMGRKNILQSSFDKIPIILGNRAEGPGFANPVTMSIEAQMLKPRKAAFFQHELVHRFMYEHTDFKVGPMGRLWGLAMYPAWWIEGLAEYLTESVGAKRIDGVLRSVVLQNNWPSWERMHSLYNADSDTNLRGYVVAGRFLRWILNKIPEKDLFIIHKQISTNTITLPFYNALDSWLYDNLFKTGEELYFDFQKEEKQFWLNETSKYPSIYKAQEGHTLFQENYDSSVYTYKNNAFISRFVSTSSLKKSSLNSASIEYNKMDRHVFPYSGSPLFAVNNEQFKTLATNNRRRFSNNALGDEIMLYQFKSEQMILNENQLALKKIISLSSENRPIIEEMKYDNNNNLYMIGYVFGEAKLFVINSHSDQVQALARFSYPNTPSLLGFTGSRNEKNTCALLLVQNDFETSSIEEICQEGQKKIILEKGKYDIQTAFYKDNKFYLLVRNGFLLSLIEYHENQAHVLAIIPEWVEKIELWNDPASSEIYFAAWIYNNSKYELIKVSINKLKLNYQSVFESDKKFISNKFEPRFIKFYNENKNILFDKNSIIADHKISQFASQVEQTFPETQAASYQNKFLFAYPYGLPPLLGGPLLGVFGVPYTDDLERFRLLVFGGYYFDINAPIFNISYYNNRLLDQFIVSAYSAPLFNGTFYKLTQDVQKNYFNYLKNEGISLDVGLSFPPNKFSLRMLTSLEKLSPYSNFTQAPQDVGVQKTYRVTINPELKYCLFENSFFLNFDKETKNEWMIWNAFHKVGVSQVFGFGESVDSYGNNLTYLNYYSLSSVLNTNLLFYDHSIFATLKIGTTKGKQTLNLKESYSVYNHDPLHGNLSYSFVTVPLLTSGSPFDFLYGNWSYSNSLGYSFPIVKKYEGKFLMAFVENWRAQLMMSYGGVASENNFSDFKSLTSLQTSTSVTLDIKGFQVLPSIIYGYIFDSMSWYLMTQVQLGNFL